MKLKHATQSDLYEALRAVNKKYKGNIAFKRIEPNGRQVIFTLTVNDAKAPGHRLGFSRTSKGNRRRLAVACWHVHGDFFDALFGINPAAVVVSTGSHGPITIDINGGNWQDRQIGSMADPLYYSEACDCH